MTLCASAYQCMYLHTYIAFMTFNKMTDRSAVHDWSNSNRGTHKHNKNNQKLKQNKMKNKDNKYDEQRNHRHSHRTFPIWVLISISSWCSEYIYDCVREWRQHQPQLCPPYHQETPHPGWTHGVQLPPETQSVVPVNHGWRRYEGILVLISLLHQGGEGLG